MLGTSLTMGHESQLDRDKAEWVDLWELSLVPSLGPSPSHLAVAGTAAPSLLQAVTAFEILSPILFLESSLSSQPSLSPASPPPSASHLQPLPLLCWPLPLSCPVLSHPVCWL